MHRNNIEQPNNEKIQLAYTQLIELLIHLNQHFIQYSLPTKGTDIYASPKVAKNYFTSINELNGSIDSFIEAISALVYAHTEPTPYSQLEANISRFLKEIEAGAKITDENIPVPILCNHLPRLLEHAKRFQADAAYIFSHVNDRDVTRLTIDNAIIQANCQIHIVLDEFLHNIDMNKIKEWVDSVYEEQKCSHDGWIKKRKASELATWFITEKIKIHRSEHAKQLESVLSFPKVKNYLLECIIKLYPNNGTNRIYNDKFLLSYPPAAILIWCYRQENKKHIYLSEYSINQSNALSSILNHLGTQSLTIGNYHDPNYGHPEYNNLRLFQRLHKDDGWITFARMIHQSGIKSLRINFLQPFVLHSDQYTDFEYSPHLLSLATWQTFFNHLPSCLDELTLSLKDPFHMSDDKWTILWNTIKDLHLKSFKLHKTQESSMRCYVPNTITSDKLEIMQNALGQSNIKRLEINPMPSLSSQKRRKLEAIIAQNNKQSSDSLFQRCAHTLFTTYKAKFITDCNTDTALSWSHQDQQFESKLNDHETEMLKNAESEIMNTGLHY